MTNIFSHLVQQSNSKQLDIQITESFDVLASQCRQLLVQRNRKYGDSYKLLRFDSIVDLMLMKLVRIRKLGRDSKVNDELKDILNYCFFAWLKYQKQKEEEK